MDLVVMLFFAKLMAACVFLMMVAFQLPVEFRVLGSICGWFLGFMGGFFLLAANKTPPPVKPKTHFRPQIAGTKCTGCREHIIMAGDGFVCLQCGQIYCKKCPPHEPCRSEPLLAELVEDRPIEPPQRCR